MRQLSFEEDQSKLEPDNLGEGQNCTGAIAELPHRHS